MGFELNNGTLYVMGTNGEQFKLGDNLLYGDIEVDTFSPNETSSIIGSLKNTVGMSFEMSAQDLSILNDLTCRPFEPAKNFDIEYNTPILVQARWHKKKRINKKWLKRYGMKTDTVKMKAGARVLSYDAETGECNFDVDKLVYIWIPAQKRKHFKIEM